MMAALALPWLDGDRQVPLGLERLINFGTNELSGMLDLSVTTPSPIAVAILKGIIGNTSPYNHMLLKCSKELTRK